MRSIVSIARVIASSFNFRWRSSLAQPSIDVKGVRSSWERVAKNSSLRRFAVSASWRAVCSRMSLICSSSAFLRSVMSSDVPVKPITLPSSESIGDDDM